MDLARELLCGRPHASWTAKGVARSALHLSPGELHEGRWPLAEARLSPDAIVLSAQLATPEPTWCRAVTTKRGGVQP
ncbi:MAG: hypothetical protein JWN04_5696 [Myxococcaceae bacterium]|nr:hypothetical protein [Myxococcaceae bacterium]